MKDNQHIQAFDEMLKSSLEGAQMPVPAGVWESVGTGLVTQTATVAKLSRIKLLIIKSIAVIAVAGSAGLIIYNSLMPSTPQANSNKDTTPAVTSSSDSVEENRTNLITGEPKDININVIPPMDYTHEENLYTQTDSIKKIISEIDQAQTSSHEKELAPQRSEEVISNQKVSEEKINKDPHTTEENSAASNPENNVTSEENSAPVFVEPSNVFTPDGDGLNDYFNLVVENEKSFALQIFDENGKLVFESFDKHKAWDGKNMHTGQLCKKGYYYYKVIIEYKNGFRKKETRGISLL